MNESWIRAAYPKAIDQAVAALRRTQRARLLVEGPHGAGKTEFARFVAEKAFFAPQLWCVGTENRTGAPFGAFGHLIDPSNVQGYPCEQAVASALKSRIRGHVLVVDNAEQLDAQSLTTIGELGIAGHPTIVVSAAPERGFSLTFADRYRFARVKLQPLDRGEARTVIERSLGGHVEQYTVDVLIHAAEGRLRLLAEVVDTARETGELECADGCWMLAQGAPQLPVPDGNWLPHFDRSIRDVLLQVAVAGDLPLDVLRLCAGSADINQAINSGLLSVAYEGPRVVARVPDPIIRQTLIDGRGMLARARLARRVVTALRRSGADTHEDSVRLGRLLLAANDPEPETGPILCAAQVAAVTNPHEADSLVRFASSCSTDTVSVARAATIFAEQGRWCEADRLLTKATQCAASADDTAKVSAQRTQFLVWGIGDLENAARVAHFASSHALETAVATVQAMVHGDISTALTNGIAVSDAYAAGDQSGLHVAAPAIAQALIASGHPQEAQQVVRRVLKTPAAEDQMEVALLNWALSSAFIAADDIREASALAQSRATQVLSRVPSALNSLLVGQVALAHGQIGAASNWLRQAHVVLRRHGPRLLAPVAALSLSLAHSMSGDAKLAAEALDAVRCEGAHTTCFGIDRTDMHLAWGWLAAARGDTCCALDHAQRASEHANMQTADWRVANVLHLSLALGERMGRDRLTEFSRPTQGPYLSLLLRQANAVARYNGMALDRISSEFEAEGAHLQAAGAANCAYRAHRRSGWHALAERSATRALDLAAAAGAPASPVVQDSQLPPSLTPREQQIVRLAASGQSSKEIAAHASVSIRTVENYLQRAYGKLGIHGRASLAALTPRVLQQA